MCTYSFLIFLHFKNSNNKYSQMCAQFLGWEDPLEEGMATHSSAWKTPMDREAWWTTVHGVAKSWT